MNDEGRAYQGEPALTDLVRRFEEMIKQGEEFFFDLDELEGLMDHYMDRREIRRAKAVLNHAIKLYPGSLTLRLRQAQVLANGGQTVKAVPILRELLSIEPHNDEVHLTLGSVYSHMMEHRLAVKHYKQALLFADMESRRDIRVDIALEFENLGDWKAAIRQLQEALKEDAQNDTAIYELAFCFERTLQFRQASNFYKQYVEENPYSFAAWYSLGNALQQCGRYTEAIDAYDFAIAIEDQFGPAYHQKAEALVAMERYTDALTTYRDTLAFEDASPGTQCYMGECLERLGDLETAEHCYKASLELDPNFPDACIGLGVLADLRGHFAEACTHFEQAISLDAGQADYFLLLATSYKKLGENEHAENTYIKGLLLDNAHEELWLERIDNMQMQDEHESAMPLIDAALEIAPSSIPIMYRRFISQYALKRFAQAFEYLEYLLTHHFDGAENLIPVFPALANDARFVERYEQFKP